MLVEKENTRYCRQIKGFLFVVLRNIKLRIAATSFLVIIFLSRFVILHSYPEPPVPVPDGCPPFSCGKLGDIRFPFSNTTHRECGLLEVNCEDNKINLGDESQWYDVDFLFPRTIEIHDPELKRYLDNNNCDMFNHPTVLRPLSTGPIDLNRSISLTMPHNFTTFFKCTSETDYFEGNYSRYTGCEDNPYVYYSYPNEHVLATDSLPPGCSVIQLPVNPLIPFRDANNPFQLVTAQVFVNWNLTTECYECLHKGGKCHTNEDRCAKAKGSRSKLVIEVAIATSATIVAITIVLFCYFWRLICWNKKTKDHEDIEALLKKYGPLVPERYRYSDIKKMTNSFIDKLGQGGYGAVYKGKLQDGRLVAVKILNDSKGNGEEFVNEVASISRTSHINIVTLLGFCFKGPKRALIYEFMPNGSLEKFIYNEKSLVVRQLGWETLYQIALGIARGLEYLHRGCNMRILHFDIKLHNILLDEEFSPKISDFGLAKLCPEKGSVVSMSGMRGTPGYIAPEVFFRNFGGVSHKSDVYSYGMMILEMVGGTKNPDEGVDQSSEKYFPDWIYKRLELGEEIGLNGITNGEENENKRKMIIVGLWCIQTDPSNRPSMRRVLDMLEGSLESLQIPLRPILVSPPRHQTDSSATEIM